ncbi:hypothetical protein FPQ18DRAFT_351590 [Pyronema domesticum]|uniref:Uncharacterized protein n=1 Tax=Pyronema omphalodes (strain CBS 100304) TaxID=1076935 RepID=U4LB62_PYROM|nr:hypothetical protein FPQ18DRAFT_351590 [Pyronema domesticum]CCX16432.1 Protein of unknown function [Pyronema omphalodes CBS 100304]
MKLSLISLLSALATSKAVPLGPACEKTDRLCLYYCVRKDFRIPCERKFPEFIVCYDLDTRYDDKCIPFCNR